MKLQIQDIMRANYVERWQLVNLSRRQTVAEHSFNVAMISRAIAKEMGHYDDEIREIMECALYHDLDEVITGDIPTPTKQRIRDEGVEVNDLIDMPIIPDSYKRIIKIADFLDAMNFLEENRVGRHAFRVSTIIYDRYREYHIKQHTELRTAATKIRDLMNSGALII